jgi:hypothetical protein
MMMRARASRNTTLPNRQHGRDRAVGVQLSWVVLLVLGADARVHNPFLVLVTGVL